MLENIAAYLNPFDPKNDAVPNAEDVWYLEVEFVPSAEYESKSHILALKGDMTRAEIARDIRIFADQIERDIPDIVQ